MNRRPIFCKEERELEETIVEGCKELSEMLNRLCAFLCVQMAEESHVTVDKVDRTIRKMALGKNMNKLRYSVFDKSEKAGLDPLLAMVYVSLVNASACLEAYSMG